jgi:hypothetical protein
MSPKCGVFLVILCRILGPATLSQFGQGIHAFGLIQVGYLEDRKTLNGSGGNGRTLPSTKKWSETRGITLEDQFIRTASRNGWQIARKKSYPSYVY